MNREEILLELKKNPEYIQELVEADEDFEIFIVKNNGNNIRYIKNPSKEVQKLTLLILYTLWKQLVLLHQ